MKKILLSLLLVSSLSWSLTNGPSQPEYSGFAAQSMGDIVNRYTGDFSYSIPVMDVPGINGTFPLAINYASGISLEQEASWVGLGWDMNVGAISRSLSKYPDDYDGGTQRGEMRSNTISLVEGSIQLGTDDANLKLTAGRRSDVGNMYSMSYHLLGTGTTTVTWNEKDGWGTKLQEPTAREWFIEVGTWVAARILPAQAKEVIAKAQSGAARVDAVVAGFRDHKKWASLGVSEGSKGRIGIGFSSGTVGQMKNKSQGLDLKFISFKQTDSYLYGKDNIKLYGNMFLSNFPRGNSWYTQHTSNQENIYFSEAKAKMEYSWTPTTDRTPVGAKLWINPLAILNEMIPNYAIATATPDGFSASAPGLGLSFTDYRQDIVDFFSQEGFDVPGEVALDFLDSPLSYVFWKFDCGGDYLFGSSAEKVLQEKLRLLKSYFDDYAQYGVRDCDVLEADDGKTMGSTNGCDVSTSHSPLKYPTQYSSNIPNVLFYSNEGSGAFEGEKWATPEQANSPSFYWGDFNSVMRRRNSWKGAFARGPMYPTTTGGSEIDDRIAVKTGIFPKFKKAGDGLNDFYPNNALVGFTVVSQEGSIFDFNVPVLNYVTKSVSVTEPSAQVAGKTWGGFLFNETANWESLERAYAYAWLLSSVKTADYVDLTNNGPSDDDFGGWFKLEYETIPYYHWRNPYQGASPGGIGSGMELAGRKLIKKNTKIVVSNFGQISLGVKEIKYVKAIESPTHRAEFSLSDRDDGLEASLANRGVSFKDDEQPVTLSRFSEFEILPSTQDQVMIHSKFMALKVGDILEINQKDMDGAVKIDAKVAEISAPASGSNYSDLKSRNGKFNILTYKLIPNNSGEKFLSAPFFTYARVKERNISQYARLKKLDEIKLYKKGSGQQKTEQKRVGFVYEADKTKQLAPGVVNHVDAITAATGNKGGKLTLRKVMFGISDDNGGVEWLPPYEFSYFKEGSEAPYHRDHWDRWGFYKSNGGSTVAGDNNGSPNYILDDRIDHEPNPQDVMAWSLKSVKMPTGSRLTVEYESDTYSYVGRVRNVPVPYKEEKASTKENYVNVGWEKGPSEYSGELKLLPLRMAFQKFDGMSTAGFDSKQLRISSVFRVWRKTEDNGYVMNAQFASLKAKMQTNPNFNLHLYAMVNPADIAIDDDNPYLITDNGLSLAPFLVDLGALDELIDLTTDPNIDPSVVCQLKTVSFPMWKLKSENWKYCIDAGGCPSNVPAYLKKYNLFWGLGTPTEVPTRDNSLLSEFILADNLAEAQDKTEFKADYWDFYSFQAHLKLNNNSAIDYSSGRGAPGGGVRVKRLTLNAGISAKATIGKKAAPNIDIVEYYYDCFGIGAGTFSSGVAGSLPPPYSNRGDDRPKLSPLQSLLGGATMVGYRTVTERRPGRGTIVYDFLSAADVSDYVEEPWCSRMGNCYGELAVPMFYPNKRYIVHRLNQLQGQLWRTRKYSDFDFRDGTGNAEVVALEQKRIGVMLNRYQINLLNQISIMNGSDANFAIQALVPMEATNDQNQDDLNNIGYQVPMRAVRSDPTDGSLSIHPNSNQMGTTHQRYRMRWMSMPNTQWLLHEDDTDGLFERKASDVASVFGYGGSTESKRAIHSAIGIIDVEEISTSAFVVRVDNLQHGVGTRTDYSAFDYLTGRPLIVTETTIKGNSTEGYDSKSVVTIPAYWKYPQMSPIFKHPKFKEWAVGNRGQGELESHYAAPTGSTSAIATNSNRLSEDYSVSVYRNLESFDNSEEWFTRMANPLHVLSQKFLQYTEYTLSNKKVLRNEKTVELRVPLKEVSSSSSTYHIAIEPDLPAGFQFKKPTDAIGSVASPYYNMASVHKYDQYGNAIDVSNSTGTRTSITYGTGYSKEQIMAVQEGCATDECDALNMEQGVGTWQLTSLTSTLQDARSGKYSVILDANSSTTRTQQATRTSNHELSVWFRPTQSANGLTTLTLKAGSISSKICTYSLPLGIWNRCSLEYPSVSGRSAILSIAAGSTDVLLDDLRMSPIDAKVKMFTYNHLGLPSSISDQNDVIKYYTYSRTGELFEVKDQYGNVYSTQTTHEAK